MISKNNELNVVIKEHMRDGDGSVKIVHYTDKEGLYEKGRMFAKIVLEPGCSVGYHGHEGEEEIFVIQKGTAEYNDNGKIVEVHEGDVTICRSGESHGIANKSNSTVELTALILNK